MTENCLFYLSSSGYGGWVSYTYHLAHVLGAKHVLKVANSFRGGSTFYGEMPYKNVTAKVLPKFKNAIICAVDKKHTHLLERFEGATLVIHDPTEFTDEVLRFASRNRVITIRDTVHKLLLAKGIQNTFLKHPFYRYDKFNLPRDADRALSRVDFDKNTHIICEGNNLGGGVQIYGYKNHIYYFHKLKELGFDDYYKGSYAKDMHEISRLYARTRYMVDLSTIKNDGGGTQYTFLEAEHHGCGLVLHRDWVNAPGSVYTDGENCRAVSTGAELVEALKQEPIMADQLPTTKQNARWREVLI